MRWKVDRKFSAMREELVHFVSRCDVVTTTGTMLGLARLEQIECSEVARQRRTADVYVVYHVSDFVHSWNYYWSFVYST